MKNKPLFLLDVDGVLADFASPILKHANKASLERDPTFVAKKFEDIINWNMETLFPALTPDQVFAPAKRWGFAAYLEPMEGAQEAAITGEGRGSHLAFHGRSYLGQRPLFLVEVQVQHRLP